MGYQLAESSGNVGGRGKVKMETEGLSLSRTSNGEARDGSGSEEACRDPPCLSQDNAPTRQPDTPILLQKKLSRIHPIERQVLQTLLEIISPSVKGQVSMRSC